MYDWIIIGGGIHGCTIAASLLKNRKTDINRIKIIDPYPEPLYQWKKRTETISMPFLRSPGVHHVDVNPFSLKAYGKQEDSKNAFYGPYSRPSLSLFNEHSDAVFQEVELQKAWVKGCVEKINKINAAWEVQIDTGMRLRSENLVVATGTNNKLYTPEWGQELNASYPNQAGHIFEEKVPSFVPPVAVIGGGITAAHLVIKLARLFPGKVTQIARHENRIHDFDSDPGWLGPKNMRSFVQLESYEKRRKVLTEVRHKGSVPRELGSRLKKLQEEGAFAFILDEVDSWAKKSSSIQLKLTHSNKTAEAKTVLFATGFSNSVMEAGWLQELIQEHELQCANCGFPIVDESLQWCEHLFVSGPLAELELGPSSRNIAGARKAAERIAGQR
ncbi:FAD/NAD(P)-binding protein [Jeotgalibacillus sp. ET6]|uniref:FAD-dependent oxidoreductase n=1 Tax=Jeotgalibacillus sp. ET6 TaxID=3037260 RepID=UPI00241836C8|nr:FAD/NAD(P)-binding protein [Jeotgalibacillus sp. ET6]MDG5471974.1 FAD/NAD(P)-binding protein [Jeotgalibacillus sp. ET6]